MNSSKEIIEQVCGWIGACISQFFYISPVFPIYKLMKKEMKIGDIPGVLLLCSLLCCIMWCEYGIQIDKIHVWLCNGIGGIITTIWLVAFWCYFAELNWIPCVVYNLLMFNLIAELFYLFYAFLGKEYNDYLGNAAVVFNVIMFAAPAEKIVRVFKTGQYELIPIHTSICGTVCSTFWGIYGLAITDWNIIIPNGLGMLFSFFQVIVWIILYKKRKNNPVVETENIGNDNENKDGLIAPGNKDSE